MHPGHDMFTDVGTATAIGPREENQDAVYVGHPRLFAISDGMGGHWGGQQAAQTAVGTLSALSQFETFEKTPLPVILQGAHDRILAMNRRLGGAGGTPQQQAGATLSILHVHPRDVQVCWAGDSPILRFRPGNGAPVLSPLTWHHNAAGVLWRKGEITEAGYRAHRQKNILLKGIGTTFGNTPDPTRLGGKSSDGECAHFGPPRPGDIYLMMTDGLYDALPQNALVGVLGRGGGTAQQLADYLLTLGSGNLDDNATVITVIVGG